MEALAILIFILILVLSPFLFVGWVIYSVLRAVTCGVGSMVSHSTRSARTNSTPAASGALTVRCPTDGCHAINPADAKFCRRCGHGLPAAQRVNVRRAAVW